MEATIEGQTGIFYGIFRKSTGLPDGYGVFVAGDWLHCGEVKNCVYQEGKKVSVNRAGQLLKLTNQKCLADGSVLKKVELFTQFRVLGRLLKGDQITAELVAELTPRLNGWEHDAENWLSMRPEKKKYFKVDQYGTVFGEFNEQNELEGRGIRFTNDGLI